MPPMPPPGIPPARGDDHGHASLLASTPDYDSSMPDYYVPGTCLGGSAPYWRHHFLIAARQLHPEILRTLQRDLLPYYSEHPEWPSIVGWTRLGAARRKQGKPIPLARLKAQRELLTRLKQWAEQYCVVEKCIFYEALHTLEMWRNSEEQPEASQLRWWSEHLFKELAQRPGVPVPVSAPGLDRRLIHPEPFRFEHAGWSVQLEKGKKWKAAAREAFEKALANHEQQLEKLAKKHLRTPIPSVIHRSVRWFVEYQLDDTVTYKGLASREKRSPRTIRDGVHRASRLIGLPIRRPRQGRPAGSKDSENSPRQRAGW